MGIFDRFKGKKDTSQDDASPLNDAAAAAGVSSTLDLTETPSSPHGDASAQLLGVGPDGSERLYNPYEGLGIALDRRDVKQPFRLPKEPEFVFSEEATVHRRSWSENLTYYTGTCYLIGALGGGGLGAYRTLSSPVTLPGAAAPSQRLRVNQLLNTSGRLGRTAGNSLGALGLFFASFESFFTYMNDRTLPDEAATVGAGALTGAVYRSVRGPRQAAAAAAVGTVGSLGLLAARRYINRGL